MPNRLLGSEELRGGTLTELDWCRAAGGGEGLLGLARCEADSCLDYFRVSNSLIKHAAATRIFKQRDLPKTALWQCYWRMHFLHCRGARGLILADWRVFAGLFLGQLVAWEGHNRWGHLA